MLGAAWTDGARDVVWSGRRSAERDGVHASPEPKAEGTVSYRVIPGDAGTRYAIQCGVASALGQEGDAVLGALETTGAFEVGNGIAEPVVVDAQ